MEPSTAWKERITSGEAERFEIYAQQLNALQVKNAQGRPLARALHAKGKLGVEAEFEVLAGLPEHARQGLFAEPRTYKTYVRFSNGAGVRQPDKKPDVRGVALKLVGVGGEKVIRGMEDAPTQDFLLIRSSSVPFKSADEFVPFVLAAANPLTAPFKLVARFGLGRTISLLKTLTAGLGAPMPPLASTSYFSALPIKFGPYAVRYALVPREKEGAAPRAATDSPDYLGAELAARLEQGPVFYDFQVQFFVSEAQTPIEDASVDWPESLSPYLTIGRLTLLPQDVRSPRGQRVSAFVEKLSFDPWHAQAELRPLGNMMRARNAAYAVSTSAREAGREPNGSERFDDTSAVG